MKDQKIIKIETEYNVFAGDLFFILADYWEDLTITVWSFQNELIARQCKTRSDVGMWKPKQQNLK